MRSLTSAAWLARLSSSASLSFEKKLCVIPKNSKAAAKTKKGKPQDEKKAR